MNEGTYRVIVPPTSEPVSLSEAKAQCRVDISDDDAYLTSLITVARQYCEAIDWCAYLTQTIEYWIEDWPLDDEIELPRPPLQSVTSIEYYDVHDMKTTLPTAVYAVDAVSVPGLIHLKYLQTWPVTQLRDYNAICITYQAGWDTPAYMPIVIKQAMLLLIGHWYENREATTNGTVNRSIEFAVNALLSLNSVKAF
jgi:uncharacterized phiE125 gp8 family phage protein